MVFVGGSGDQPTPPIGQTGQAKGIFHSKLVGKIVGATGEGVNGRDRGAKRAGQPKGGHRKIFVMATGEPLTGGVGFRKASFESRFGGQFVGRMGDVNMMYSPFIGNRGANPHGIVGVILSINLPKIMVKSEDGHEDTVSISSSTVVRQFRDNIAADKLKVNDNVIILGSPNEDGSINASLIRVMPSGTSTRPMPLQMMGVKAQGAAVRNYQNDPRIPNAPNDFGPGGMMYR
jgi:hypothetical protein